MGTELAMAEDKNVKVWDDIPQELLSGQGFENGTLEDMIVPRIQLAQAMTPAIDPTSELHITGLSQGDFFNNVTKRVYGPGVRIIPVLFTKNRLLFVNNKIECRSENGIDGGAMSKRCGPGHCEYAAWGSGKDGKGQACTEFRNFICWIPDERAYSIISFKKATASVGKMLYTTASTQRRTVSVKGKTLELALPIYGCEYMLRSVKAGDGTNKYFTVAFDLVRDVEDSALLKSLNEAHERFKVANFVASEEV